MQQEIIDKIKQIQADIQSGASLLTIAACDLIVDFSKNYKDCNRSDLEEDLAEFAVLLRKSQPDMAPIISLSYRMAHIAEEGEDCAAIFASLNSLCQEFKRILLESKAPILAELLQLVKDGDRLITHSSSSTVKDALISLHDSGRNFTLIATESRPSYEGREFAKLLGEAGVPCELIADAAALKLLESSTYVLVGADAVTEDFFVNKIGTLSLALGAREFFKEFYVIADTTKFLPSVLMPAEERLYSPREILQDKFPNVTVKNYYFEKIPLHLVSGVLSEKGFFSPRQVARYISQHFK